MDSLELVRLQNYPGYRPGCDREELQGPPSGDTPCNSVLHVTFDVIRPITSDV